MSMVLFIGSLFDWLLERSWQGGLLAVLIVLARRVFGATLSANWRYGLWFVLLGLLVLPALPQSPISIYNILPKVHGKAGAMINPEGPLIALPISRKELIPADSDPTRNFTPSEQDEAGARWQLGVMQWMAVTWLGVASGLAGFLLVINLRFAWQIRRRSGATDPRLTGLFFACQEELGIRRRVALVEMPGVTNPAIMGLFRPTLLVPVGFAENFDRAEIRYVFFHELGHLLRGDVQVDMAIAILQTLHWFNPFLWWAFQQMREDRELACDAWVLSRMGARENSRYGELLLKLMDRFQPGDRMAGMVGILENQPALKLRIERIAGFSGKIRGWSSLGGVVVIGLSVFFLTGARNGDLAASSEAEVAQPAPDPAVGRICDRNGMVLVEYRLDNSRHMVRNRPFNFPFGALAAQLLSVLDKSAQPEPGETIWLTIDGRIQMVVEEELRKVGRGAAVVLDPNNGDILAMASVPSFDPNQLYPSVTAKDWAKLVTDNTSPLLNRTINAYVPGSTFKPVTALAGIAAGLESRAYTCTGGLQVGNVYMKCWIFGKGAHGTLTLPEALEESCDSYFYQYGIATGAKIQVMADLLGLGKTSGIPIRAENPGVVDGPEHLKEANPSASWSDALAANMSMGQGAMLMTPLQAAGVMEAIGNGGILYWPRLVEKIRRRGGETLEQPRARVRADLLSNGVTKSGLELVRSGLWKAVNEKGGTSPEAAMKRIEVAGKSGSAQVWRVEGDKKIKDGNSWFSGFAPFKNPRYAFAILVQGSDLPAISARLAANMLSRFDGNVDSPWMAPLKAAQGNFEPIDESRLKANSFQDSPDHPRPQIAQPIPGKSGMVKSPISGKELEVSGFPSGKILIDPYSGQPFITP